MIRRPPRSTQSRSSAASDVYKRQVVGLLLKDGAPAKEVQDTTAKHGYFVRLLDEASQHEPVLSAVASALSDPERLEQIRAALTAATPRARPTDKVTLRIGGRFPVESDAWHGWWRVFRKTLSRSADAGGSMLCLATGELVAPARTHPKINGLADVGGMGMGSSLVGYDKDAFQSYGLSQSENGAVSEQAAAEYRAALNDLIERHSRRLAGAKVAHWFTHSVPPEDDPLEWIETPQEAEQLAARQKANELLDSIRTGTRPNLQGNRYYALTISGAAGRAMVRDWMEGQFEDLVRNVTAWFDDLSIMRRDGSGLASPPKFMAVLGSTVRALDDLAAPSVTALWRSALTRGPIPGQFLAQALARARIDIIEDQNLNHARFGLIKAFHVRQGDSKVNPYLNEDHPSPAYHCGRLMAVYARLQYAALGDVGADEMLQRVGAEPSGEAFNAISLEPESGRPANPLINAGAILTTSLVRAADPAERFERILGCLSAFAGRPLTVDEDVFRSELATASRNRALAYLMASAGSLQGDVEETVAGVKRQHNVLSQLGVNPEEAFGYGVIEPLLQLRKDGVRKLARALGNKELGLRYSMENGRLSLELGGFGLGR